MTECDCHIHQIEISVLKEKTKK